PARQPRSSTCTGGSSSPASSTATPISGTRPCGPSRPPCPGSVNRPRSSTRWPRSQLGSRGGSGSAAATSVRRTPSRPMRGAPLALEDLRRVGIPSIHDVARLDAVSQRQLFHTHVERSATDLELFRELQRRGELTARVYAFLTLAVWRDIVAAGIRPRTDEGL